MQNPGQSGQVSWILGAGVVGCPKKRNISDELGAKRTMMHAGRQLWVPFLMSYESVPVCQLLASYSCGLKQFWFVALSSNLTDT